MISAEWLLLLLPCLFTGIFIGYFLAKDDFRKNPLLARNALKHAEAYVEYKRKIKESSL
jgi:uncharacterized protein YneF (UPF0154 family)